MKFINSLSSLDSICLSSIFGLKGNRFFSFILPWVSRSADGYYYPLIPVALLLIDYETAKSFFAAGIASFAIELPAYKIIKQGIKRSRPFEVLSTIQNRVYPSDRFSLPSGHSSAAFIIVTLIAHLYPFLSAPALVWALLVGMSRIYLGVHYPSDVVAGMVLGIISGVTGIQITGQFL